MLGQGKVSQRVFRVAAAAMYDSKLGLVATIWPILGGRGLPFGVPLRSVRLSVPVECFSPPSLDSESQVIGTFSLDPSCKRF